MTMSSDDEVEYTNARAKLLPTNNEHRQKLHEELEKFTFPRSDSEGSREENLEMSLTGKVHQSPSEHNVGSENDKVGPRGNTSWSCFLYKFPKRFIVLILLAFGNFNMYCVRMCLSVTIVAMTHAEENNSKGKMAHFSNTPEFHWDKEFQGIILSSLYWGYTTMQIPAGLLSFKFGGTFLVGFAVFGSSVLTLVTPFIVRQNVHAFIVLRILEGAFLGLVGASGYTIVSKWAPIYERSIFQTVSFSGLLAGTVFANSLSGVLAASAWGWPSVFYFFGFLGVLWYLFWIYFVYEEPSDHPNITEDELKLIGKHWNSKEKLSFRHIPWRYILTSFPVWALIISNFTDCWGFYTFIMSFPSYLSDVLNYDIAKVGFASSLPYAICCIMSPLWGFIVDTLRSKKRITTLFARKLSSFIGSGVSALFIIGIGYSTTRLSALAMVTAAISISSFACSGPAVNTVEIAPKYSGILMGIVNFACNITGFICPVVVGALTNHGDPHHQWRVVFFITASINVFGMLVYCCLASAEKQAWAEH